MRIQKNILLGQLESVTPGVAKDVVTLEQSKHFVFSNGKLITFNDEVACCRDSPFGDEVVGAVKADKLLDVLRRTPDEDLQVYVDKNQLVLSGRGRRSKFLLEKEIILPVNSLETPSSWETLPENFCAAAKETCGCAGRDESTVIIFLHIHPKWIEATDRHQILRWPMICGNDSSVLVRANCMEEIVGIGVSHWFISETWIHFKSTDVNFMCRRYQGETFPDLGSCLEGTGEKIKLSKQLAAATKAARIFSSERGGEDLLRVDLKPGKVRIVGEGITGSHEEWGKLDYSGASISFYMSPEILSRLIISEEDCEVLSGKLLIRNEKYVYVTSLLHPDSNE
jgi:hypothetical protein